mgnify:CR=1 FL=1
MSGEMKLPSFKNGHCERCLKHVDLHDGVHTCTPTKGWREMEQNVEIGMQMCGTLMAEIAELKDFAFDNTDPTDMTREDKVKWYRWFAGRVG